MKNSLIKVMMLITLVFIYAQCAQANVIRSYPNSTSPADTDSLLVQTSPTAYKYENLIDVKTYVLGGNATSATTAGTLTGALSANQLLGSLTAVAPTGQSVPSCSTSGSALLWTSGSGFSCNTGIVAASAASSTSAVTAGTLTGAISANQVLGALSAVAPTGLTIPSCSTSGSALLWTSGVGFSCNTAIVASSSVSTSSATSITITDDTTTNSTMYPVWVTANTGDLPAKVASSKMTFNPSTGTLSATTFSGAGTNLTGTAASLTAGTVTTNANLTGPITSVGNAVASLAAHNVLTGNGSSAVNSVAPGTSGNVLTSNGTDWVSTSASSGSGSVIRLFANNAIAGNPADNSEDTLITYTLPANSLAANGDRIRVTADCSTASNSNTKTIKLYFGSQFPFFFGAGALNNTSIHFDMLVMRTSSGGQIINGTGASSTTNSTAGASNFAATVTGTQTDSSTIVVKLTGQSGSSVASDIVCNQLTVEFLSH